MEVTIRRKEPLRAVIERMQATYGDLAGAQDAAKTDPAATEAVYWLKEYEGDPGIIEGEATTTTLLDVDPASLPKLTTRRQQLVETVRGMNHASIQEVAIATGRDYKNVHADLAILEDIGLVQSHKHGKQRIVQAFPTEIVIA